MTGHLLHLCTPADWRAALDTGSLAPASLAEVGFTHLSTPEQVALPAQRLFAGRRDLVLLAVARRAIDEAGVEVRWEPGVPGDPESMRFPHAYGAIPVPAVHAVLPYRPDREGRFSTPVVPVLDAPGRAAVWEPSLLRRAADREIPVTGGVGVRADAVPASRRHNRLLVQGTSDAVTVAGEADRALDGLAYRAATLYGETLAGAAADLRGQGWTVQELRLMTAPAGPADGPGAPVDRVEQVDVEMLRPAWERLWRRELPEISADGIAQLTDRYRAEESFVRLLPLAVRDGADVVASCLLKVDGATAWLDSLETEPAHRGRGHATALVAAARHRAAAERCDLVALTALAGDRPHDRYARIGFTDAGRAWTATRDRQ